MVEVRIAFSCVVLRWAESRSGSSCIQLSRFQLSLPKACVSWLWKCKSTLKPPTTWCNSVCYSYLRLPFSSWHARQVYAQAAHCWDGAARIATSPGVPGFQHLHWQQEPALESIGAPSQHSPSFHYFLPVFWGPITRNLGRWSHVLSLDQISLCRLSSHGFWRWKKTSVYIMPGMS